MYCLHPCQHFGLLYFPSHQACAFGPINLLKTKRDLLFISNQPYRAVNTFHHGSKTSQLMMYKVKVVVYAEIRIKHSTQGEHHVEFFNTKPGGT